jgi:threonine/homoserine/homoserine lactone efflux protein
MATRSSRPADHGRAEVLGEAIGDLLPSAVGVALSPLPIVAVILMLGTPRARTNGPAFAAGWVAGLVAVGVIVLLVAGDADSSDNTSTTVDVVVLVFGVSLLAVAVRQWQGRPKAGETPEMPKWMATIDNFTAGRSLGLGVLLSAVNPKNLALTLTAAASLAQAGLSAGGDAVGLAVFVVIGSLTVAGPVVAYLVLGERAERPLGEVKQFMADHNAVIMAVVCLVLAAKLIGNGIGGLTD